MRKIVLLSTTHLSKNPRLVKEILALHQIYILEVIYFWTNSDLILFDRQIEESFSNVKFRPVIWTSKLNFSRFFFTLFTKILKVIFITIKYDILPEQRLFSGFLPILIKARTCKTDSYNAHNIGVLAAGMLAARKNNVLCVFDAEDYHRGELNIESEESKLIIKLEDKYIPQLTFLCVSSPKSALLYGAHYPQTKIICINNVFPTNNEVCFNPKGKNNIKLVWFSQHVGTDRGLENIISGINLLSNTHSKFTFDIFGAADNKIINSFRKLLTNQDVHISFKGVVSPMVLEQSLPFYDIGIAAELGNTVNKNTCLTNKIFGYIQAGLAILASNTDAQLDFMQKYNNIGLSYQNESVQSITMALRLWDNNATLLNEHKKNSFEIGKNKLNWKVEQKKLLVELENVLI